MIYVSATPGERELRHIAEITGQEVPDGLMHVAGGGGAVKPESDKPESVQTMEEMLGNIEGIAKMEIRPTGLLDPVIEVRPTEGQVQDLLSEINERVQRNERVLVTVLTIKFAEEVSEYLERMGVKSHYLHSEIDTLERTEIIKALRVGHIDVIVGINLLREGLDIPEVSLVAIFDSDKQGFLRKERSLLQTIGRASRNSNGSVILYADSVSPAMEAAISQTVRRRKIQSKYNEENGIIPITIDKPLPKLGEETQDTISGVSGKGIGGGRRMVGKASRKKGIEGFARRFDLGVGIWNPTNSVLDNVSQPDWAESPNETIGIRESASNNEDEATIVRLQQEMIRAADRLDFERAAELRDGILKIQNPTN